MRSAVPPYNTALTPITEKELERKRKQQQQQQQNKKKGDDHCGRQKHEKFKAAMRK